MTLWIAAGLYVGLTCVIYLFFRFNYLRTRQRAPQARRVFVLSVVAAQLFISALFIPWLGHELYAMGRISIAWTFVLTAGAMALLFASIAVENKATGAFARDLRLQMLRLQRQKPQASAERDGNGPA
jgi:hypothetical protein